MATDRDEQQRQQQELEEIRRSFAEMGARMGSLFEPADADEHDSVRQSAQPPAPAAPLPSGTQGRPRWWWAGALALLFIAGTAFGWVLPKGGDDPDEATPPRAATATTTAPETTRTTVATRTVPSVPETCLEMAELADEIISKLTRNDRDDRLALDLIDYSVANQACREEASP